MAIAKLAGGRPLPRLLFVTAETTKDAFDTALSSLITSPHKLIALNAAEAATSSAAADRTHKALRDDGPFEGVVLIGNYDTVPSQLFKAIHQEFPNELPGIEDQPDFDRFQVWSDDCYGDLVGDHKPDLPVSRIPFDNNGEIGLSPLSVQPSATGRNLLGFRDPNFAYGQMVFESIPNNPAGALMSVPTTGRQPLNNTAARADAIYFVMHGYPGDQSNFHIVPTTGAAQLVLEIGSLTVPPALGSLIFASCCWSGIVVNHRASESLPPKPLTVDESIVLTFLLNGGSAFIGFTGSQWAPLDSPYKYWGAPLHENFWNYYRGQGYPPAKALFEAKADYIANTPYLRTGNVGFDTLSSAIELKTFWSATCFGLGW